MEKKNDKFGFIIKSQLIAWLIYFAIQLSIGLSYTENVSELYLRVIFYKLFYCLSGFSLLLLFSKFCLSLLEKIKLRGLLIVIVLFFTYLLSYIWLIIAIAANSLVWGTPFEVYWMYGFIEVFRGLFYQLAGFVALFFFVNYWYETLIQKQKVLETTTLLQHAQLQMLRYQLNPHFLFNSLNSLRALIIKDQEKAREMVTSLSDFIRYSLISDQEEEVTIEKEMSVIGNFIDIQKIRFGKNLDVSIDINPEVAHYKIPSFLIHTLVENAVKYGIQTSPKPLKLIIKINRTGEKLIINIANSGKLIEAPVSFENNKNGSGIGLVNIQKRLENKYSGKYCFELNENEGWVHANIWIIKNEKN